MLVRNQFGRSVSYLRFGGYYLVQKEYLSHITCRRCRVNFCAVSEITNARS